MMERVGMMGRGALLLLAWGVVTACGKREQSRAETRDTTAAPPPVVADTGLVQERADWAAFRQSLSREPAAAAVALETYRRDHGLPLDFFLRSDAPEALTRTLRKQDDEMGCGTLLPAFVRRMPRDDAVLESLSAIEIDSTGRTLRQWPLPGYAGFYEIVAGAVGEELIVAYPDETISRVFMRIRPDGEYVVSAQPPPPLEPEEWIEVAESVWVRVRPKDDGSFSRYSSGKLPGPLGTWIPSGDSGWYVRTDSVPGERSRARATKLPGEPSPRLVSCPKAAEFEGMICRGFPGAEGERRIAYPIPCT